MNRFGTLFSQKKPIIGMVHLRPLPGSALYDPTVMDMDRILSIARDEAKMLEDAGVDGVQVENMWDIPYLPGRDIGPETVAALAVGVYEVRKHVSVPVGAECHMNGADLAMAAAVAAGARWIRVFEWCNAFISQSGYIESIGGRWRACAARSARRRSPACAMSTSSMEATISSMIAPCGSRPWMWRLRMATR